MEFNKTAFDVVHRLSDREDAPIIIKFNTRTDRDKFFNNRSLLKNVTIKDLGYDEKKDKKNKIFINESLTKPNKILFKSVRNTCKAKNYDYCGTKNGVIFARKNADATAVKINREMDLKR